MRLAWYHVVIQICTYSTCLGTIEMSLLEHAISISNHDCFLDSDRLKLTAPDLAIEAAIVIVVTKNSDCQRSLNVQKYPQYCWEFHDRL